MGSGTSIKKNTIYNIIKSVMKIVFPLITFPYISRVLGAESVGKINFGNSIVSYISLIATLGVTTYAVRACSKVRDDREKLGEVASQIFSINMITTIGAYIILLILLLFASPLESYRELIVIQSSVVLFATWGTEWINNAMEDFKYITIRTFIFQVISILLMFVFVREPEDYIVYAIISVLSSSGANIANIIYRRKYCRIRFTTQCEFKTHMPPILLLFSLILTQTIYVNSDMTILGLIRGDYEVGLYSTAVRLYNIVNSLVASIALVVMPRMSMLFVKKDYTEINNLVRYAVNCVVTIGFPCIVGLNVIAEELIWIFAGEEFLGATLALRLLTVALTASFFGGIVLNVIMLPSGRDKIGLKVSIVCAIVNFITNMILIPYFGLYAAAFTTALAEVVGLCLILPRVEKEIRLENVKEIILAPLTGCVGIVLIAIIMNALVENLIVKTGLIIIGSVMIYITSLVVCKHEFALGMIKPIINRIKKSER